MDGERVPVVVLDPGHGGTARIGGSSSNNAVGPDGTLEKDVALDLASRTAGLLSGSARTILTRTTDANLSLADRAAVARANHADVFVSIHLNGFHDPGVDGTEVWIARAASQASADLAREVLDRLVAVTGVADRGVRRADLGVLVPARHDPATAACLAEIAFLTNPAQSARLSTDAYRQQIAQALTAAVLDRIRVPAAVGAPLSVSAPQTGAGATILSNGNGNGHHDGPSDARMLAAAIGGYGATAPPRSIGLDATTLGYGVPGGTITDGFYRDATERQAVTGRTGGRSRHLGIDVSLSNAHGGGATDDRRGLPVYATPKAVIDLADLNGVRVARNDETLTGLGIDGQGAARLQHAIVLAQPWSTQDDSAYGGVVGLACRYAYTRTGGSVGTFTLYLEYLHLITPAFLPKDGQGRTISGQAWEATGKGIGFGPRIRNGDVLTAADLTGGDPVLVGYLGATQFPHVHIQAAFASGEQRYLRVPRFDPAVMLQASSTTQSLAAGPSLTFNDRSFTYDVPGTVEPLVSPTPALCWATVATMLVSWRDQQPHPITMVCEMAGPEYRARFDAGVALPMQRRTDFLARLGLEEEPPAHSSVETFLRMLHAYGPLWVGNDAGGADRSAIHGRLMTGLYGDGGPDTTFVWLINPADGGRTHETFRQFMAPFEQLARHAGAGGLLGVQVLHNASRSGPTSRLAPTTLGRGSAWGRTTTLDAEAPPTVALFPPAVADPMSSDAKLQTALDNAIAVLEARRSLKPGKLPVAFSFAEITTAAGPFPFAGFRQDETHYIASEAKVSIMYAAYALRDMVRRFATSTGAASSTDLFDALVAQMDPSIRTAVPLVAAATNITDHHRVPAYRSVFSATSGTGGLDVEFLTTFEAALEGMIVPSNNQAAGSCVRGVGYGYLNGALAAGGLFDTATSQGLWEAGDFQKGAVWPYVRITSVNDGPVAQAGTARTMAQLVSLIATRRLLDTASCDQMLDRLGRAAVGPDQPWADRPGILRPGCITHNKLGLGPLKSGNDVRSEVSVLTDPTGSGRTYVVAWQNLIGMRPIGFADIATLIRDTIEEFERP